MTTTRRLWIGLLILAILTPLGILVPQWLGASSAWGEWSSQEVGRAAGYVPRQLQRLGGLWHAPLPGYSSPGAGQSPAAHSLWYVVSAVVGLALVVGLSLLLGRWLAKNERAAEVDN